MDPESRTGVFLRRGEDTYRFTVTMRRSPCDDDSRGWGNEATSQGMPRLSESHQKLEKTRKDSSPELLEEAQLS